MPRRRNKHGFTFELTVPPELEDEAEELMEQLAMDNVTDPDEIERRVEEWLERKAMEEPEEF